MLRLLHQNQHPHQPLHLHRKAEVQVAHPVRVVQVEAQPVAHLEPEARLVLQAPEERLELGALQVPVRLQVLVLQAQ